jgi:hypothetical protein
MIPFSDQKNQTRFDEAFKSKTIELIIEKQKKPLRWNLEEQTNTAIN